MTDLFYDRNSIHIDIGNISTGYRVTISFKNPRTGKYKGKQFTLRFTNDYKTEHGFNKPFIKGVIEKVIEKIPLKELHTKYNNRDLKSIIHNELRKIKRSKKKKYYIKNYEEKGYKNYKNNDNIINNIKKSTSYINNPPPFHIPNIPNFSSTSPLLSNTISNDNGIINPKKITETQLMESTCNDIKNHAVYFKKNTSFFEPEKTGVTYAIIGKSFSGKTYFIIQELNKLSKNDLMKYNAIILFTESTSAEPLKMISNDLKKKLIVLDRLCPKILYAIKKINNDTNNLFKFLIIFDDILDLRGKLLTKTILTLRNSNISTIISIQYEKLVSPAQRLSFHNIILFNLRSEQWEYMLKGFILGNIKDKLRTLKNIPAGSRLGSVTNIAQIMRQCMEDYILYYNQRKDEVIIFHKEKQK